MIDEVKNFISQLPVDLLDSWIISEKDINKIQLLKYIKAEKKSMFNSSLLENLKVISNKELIDIVDNKRNFIEYDEGIKNAIERKAEIATRAIVEDDKNYRQLVANSILIKCKDHVQYYGFLKRNAHYNEHDLRNKVGLVGGHVNINDVNIYHGLVRETSEELMNFSFEKITSCHPLGFIKEDDKEVGSKHLCCLYVIHIDEDINICSSEKNEELVWLDQNQAKVEILNHDENFSIFDSWAYKAIRFYLMGECE